MDDHVYIIWESPDYCYDGCCSVIAGVYTDRLAAETDRERLEASLEKGDELQYKVARYNNGLQDREY